MRFCDLTNKEVININDCKCLGNVRDLEIGIECGEVEALIVPGPGKFLGCFGREFDFFIPWSKVIKIGPDIILVDFHDKDMRKKL